MPCGCDPWEQGVFLLQPPFLIYGGHLPVLLSGFRGALLVTGNQARRGHDSGWTETLVWKAVHCLKSSFTPLGGVRVNDGTFLDGEGNLTARESSLDPAPWTPNNRSHSQMGLLLTRWICGRPASPDARACKSEIFPGQVGQRTGGVSRRGGVAGSGNPENNSSGIRGCRIWS